MIVAAHQPLYLPWLGFFDKVAKCDRFVLMDDLQFTSQNYQNRNRVKVNNGTTWLTVPLVHRRRDERICDKEIMNRSSRRHHWQRRSWRTLTIHYGKARYFDHYAEALEQAYTRQWTRLLDLDTHLLTLMLGWLGIKTDIILASTLGLRGQRSDRILDMCTRLSATTYLSGAGGSREYLDVEKFNQAGIGISWQQFNHPTYPQRYPEIGFLRYLSALDLLLNCGPTSADLLLGRKTAAPTGG